MILVPLLHTLEPRSRCCRRIHRLMQMLLSLTRTTICAIHPLRRNCEREGDSWHQSETAIRQKEFSAKIDDATADTFWHDQPDPHFRVHLPLSKLPGASDLRTIMPPKDGREIDNPLFKVDLKRLLIDPVFPHGGICLCCGDPLDVYSDHALTCR